MNDKELRTVHLVELALWRSIANDALSSLHGHGHVRQDWNNVWVWSDSGEPLGDGVTVPVE